MQIPFSEKVKRILTYSKDEADRLHNKMIEPEHLMLGILKDGSNKATDILRTKFMVDCNSLQNQLEQECKNEASQTRLTNSRFPASLPFEDEIIVDDSTSDILRLGMLEAKVMNSKEVDVEHVLLGFLKHKSINLTKTKTDLTSTDLTSAITNFLSQYEISYDKVLCALTESNITPKTINSEVDFDDDEDDEEDDAPPSSASSKGAKVQTGTKTNRNSDTPAIDTFGTDISQMAHEGKLDPVVGREKEIERIAQILSRRKKNNPILIGEPGVGKSAIVEGLAIRIENREVSRVLFNKRIISIDMSSIVAGTKYRGQFEERMKSVINELKAHPEIIVFIDEIHNLIGAGNQAGQMDAANMMKPALSRGELQCIGATTLEEYRKSIEKDGALERRFQKVLVEPTTKEETLEILRNIKEKYEAHHNVIYTDDALKACVNLADRYMTDRFFPDKAIDAMDEAGSRVHIGNISVPKEIEKQEELINKAIIDKESAVKAQDYEKAAEFRDYENELKTQLDSMRERWEAELNKHRQTVNADNVAETVSLITGVPVSKMAQDEGIRLKGMRHALKDKVIAQDKAIDKLVSAIQRSRIGLKDPNRPIGTFMFLGPTGVGKTYLAKQLAEYMFGSSDSLIRIDMSEYMEKFTVSRLVGAPPGYVGYEEGGMLTEKVRRKPYSIILLDEMEKAHQDVFNILLQVMDDGRLTDSYGRTVDFRNTVIIMTSNVGTRQLKDFGTGIGFSASDKSLKDVSQAVITKALNKQFSPEFINRIDEIITFEQLQEDDILKIIDIELLGLYKRVKDMGLTLEITPEAKHFIAHKGYDKQYGARPLRRAIQKYLEDEISDIVIEETLPAGTILKAELQGETVRISHN